MKLKSLLILLVITSVLAGLSTLLLRPQAEKQPQIGTILLPELPVNKIARVTLTSAEGSVVLVKGESIWQVENRYAFPADFGKLSEFVRKLSKLKIGRSFEASPETLERLQLIDPTQTDADPAKTGISFKLADATGKSIAAYIIGSTRSTDGGSGGQYLRQAEGNTIYLVDEGFRFLKKTPAEWLQQDILNIKEEEVAQVVCYPAGSDKPRFQVSRPEKGKPAALLEVPKDRQVDTTKIEQLLGALAPLKIKDLAAERRDPAEGRDPAEDGDPAEDRDPAKAMGEGLHLTYRLYNGQQIHIFPRKEGEDEAARYELQAFVSYEAPPETQAPAPAGAAVEKKKASGEEKNAPEASEPAADAAKAPTQEEMQALTADLNAKVSGWTFIIEKWQWQSLITEVEGLLEAVKKEEQGSDG